jgi:putative N6-adenine-specific DNA methylase
MCGSGTIAVEAALIAADRAPGLTRTFGFQKLAWYDGPTWQRVRQKAVDRAANAPASAQPAIFASDHAAPAVAKAQANARSAKVERHAVIERADVLTREAPAASGLIVSNPPYGVRLGDQERMAAFYPRLGDALKQHFAGWHAWLLTGDLRLAKLIGLRVERRIPLFNGAIECRLFGIPLVAGRHGKPAPDARISS